MKRIILILFLPSLLFAQNAQKVSSTIEKVTVYFSGASVTRTAKVNLTIGKNELTFTELPPSLNKESIQMAAFPSLDFASIKHSLSNQKENDVSLEIKNLNLEKEKLQKKMDFEKQSLSVFQREEEMLYKNQVVGGSYSGLKPADLKELMDYHRNRMQEILSKKQVISEEIGVYEQQIRNVNTKLSQFDIKSNKSFSEIQVIINSKVLINNAEIKLTYFVQNAGWKPTYNLKVISVEEPMDLLFQGQVYQYSGEDWKNTKLELSNANPQKTGNAPVLKPWIWGISNDYSEYFNAINIVAKGLTQVYGTIRDQANQPLPGVNVFLKGTSLGGTTDINGFYRVNIPPDLQNKPITISAISIGFRTEERIIRYQEENFKLIEDSNALDEVVVVGYGQNTRRDLTGAAVGLQGRSSGINVTDSKRSAIKETKRLVIDTETPLTQNYELIEKYTVLSDGQEVTAELKSLRIPAEFEYRAVPKIDPEAFLIAKVIDWNQYGLLNGEMNLYFEGVYLGKSNLSLTSEDTLSISLGRDKNVIVKRNKQKQYSKSQIFGNKKTDQFVYEILVRNLKKQTINIVVEDQVPLSFSKDVEITDREAQDATIDSESGITKWNINLESGKEKKLNLKFSVRYPKNGIVEVD